MTVGKFDYLYRLSAARFLIFRMRASRFIKSRLGIAWPKSKGSARSKPMLRSGLFTGLLGVSVAVWAPFEWLGDTNRGEQDRLTALRFQNTNPSESPLLAQSKLPAVGDGSSVVLAEKVGKLAKVLNTRQAENEALKSELKSMAAEIQQLQDSAENTNFQLAELAQEKQALEQSLREQQELLAERQARWQEALVEKKVVYNITNIPVGGFVTGVQLPNDAEPGTAVKQDLGAEYLPEGISESSEEELLARSIEESIYLEPELEYELQNEENSVVQSEYAYRRMSEVLDENSPDRYDTFRETMRKYRSDNGIAGEWSGDAYLSQMIEEDINSGPAQDLEVVMDDASDEILFAEPGAASNQTSFFGPAPDRYENLIEESMPDYGNGADAYTLE